MADLIERQQRVHRSGAKAFQVESHEFEAQLFEDGSELRGHGRIQGARQFRTIDLDSDDVSVMAHPKLTEAQGTKRVLAALHNVQRLPSDGAAVFNAGGEAGRGGLVPDAKVSIARQGANLLLGQSGVEERGGDMVLSGCSLPGSEISLVVKINAVCNRLEITGCAHVLHNREEFVLALKATLAVVASVFRAIEFGGR